MFKSIVRVLSSSSRTFATLIMEPRYLKDWTTSKLNSFMEVLSNWCYVAPVKYHVFRFIFTDNTPNFSGLHIHLHSTKLSLTFSPSLPNKSALTSKVVNCSDVLNMVPFQLIDFALANFSNARLKVMCQCWMGSRACFELLSCISCPLVSLS